MKNQIFGVALFGGILIICTAKKSFFWNLGRISLTNSNKLLFVGTSSREQLRQNFDVSQTAEPCELEIINNGNSAITFCWVSPEGNLHHYRRICDTSIKDGSVSNRHVECALTGHVFVGFLGSARPNTLDEIDSKKLMFIVRPNKAKCRHVICVEESFGALRSFRSTKVYVAAVTPMAEAVSIIDNSNKRYCLRLISQFRVLYEEGVFERVCGLEECLSSDLSMISALVPQTALNCLRDSTSIYINDSMLYGPKDKPIVGSFACFHPKDGQDWLAANGFNVNKAGCIEVYSAAEYLRSRAYWGVGGLLLHELSHSYHNQHCKDGFDCSEVIQCFEAAMEKCLYDCVDVHTEQGAGYNKQMKAYACTNCMEFFAELSVAYHWTWDDSEYNKWFPHNRQQLLLHDTNTFEVLNKLWTQYEMKK